jgi:hypothetical protein
LSAPSSQDGWWWRTRRFPPWWHCPSWHPHSTFEGL